MLSRLLEPAARERDRRGDPNEHSDGCQSQQTVQQLKDEVPPTRAQPSAPTPADVTLLREHAVEQHEAHHTTDVHEDESYRERGDDEDRGEGRERRQQRGSIPSEPGIPPSGPPPGAMGARRFGLLHPFAPSSPASKPTKASFVHCAMRNGLNSCCFVCSTASVIESAADIANLHLACERLQPASY